MFYFFPLTDITLAYELSDLLPYLMPIKIRFDAMESLHIVFMGSPMKLFDDGTNELGIRFKVDAVFEHYKTINQSPWPNSFSLLDLLG